MAKLLRHHQLILPACVGSAPQAKTAFGKNSAHVAMYDIQPELAGNVDFVLFLSGNSTFCVEVMALED